jgi:hypothetical protein
MLFPSGALQGIPHPHSHSIVLSHRNALIFQCKFFLRIAKNRLGDLSEFRALDFKEEFRRSVICMVSATIGIHQSIFSDRRQPNGGCGSQKDRHHALNQAWQRQPAVEQASTRLVRTHPP